MQEQNPSPPWNKEFCSDIEQFLKTAHSFDLLRVLVRFSCSPTEEGCKLCPLASHNFHLPGRTARAWGQRNKCGVWLVAVDANISEEHSLDFSAFGQSDGGIKRMINASSYGAIDWRWWRLRDYFIYGCDPIPYYCVWWAEKLFDVSKILFEFIPMWGSQDGD